MAQRTDGLIKGFRASGTVFSRRIVLFGPSNIQASQAVTAFAASIGVSMELAADGEPLDVALSGIADVDYGGPVTRGDFLTADALGRAVAAVAAGSRIIGQAMASGVLGDIGMIHIAKCWLPGGAGIPANALLGEDGQPLLSEDGSYILLE